VATKKNFVLRLDEEVYKALERWAADEFRSVNGQLEWLIDTALKKAGRKGVSGNAQMPETAPGTDKG
jgi:hypothetical protein